MILAALAAAAAVSSASPSAAAQGWPAQPVPDYGIAEGQCRPHEPGPAIVATATGLKDRKGTLRLELYAPAEGEFLGDDRDLVRDGKVFRRAVMPVPATGAVELCIRAPHAGDYALALIHDRAGKKKFSLTSDGIGFSGNPRLHGAKPHADEAKITIGPGVTPVGIRLNYLHGLLQFGPLDGRP